MTEKYITDIAPNANVFKLKDTDVREYIARILMSASELHYAKPDARIVVFMTRDIMYKFERDVIEKLVRVADTDLTTVCGYKLKLTDGENELYVGFDI